MDELLRQMPPAAKFARVLALGEVTRGLALVRLRAAHPGASDSDLRRMLALELLPRAVAERLRANPRR